MNDEQRDGLDSMLDSMLDAAMRDYSNQAPRAGLERRIVVAIQSTSPKRRSAAWIGWVLAPVAVAALVLAVITTSHDQPNAQPLPQVARVVQSPVQPLPPSTVRRNARVIRKRDKLPELETFPGPEPLTPEEQALLRFVRSEPEQARELFADSEQMKEITIEPLEIEILPIEMKE